MNETRIYEISVIEDETLITKGLFGVGWVEPDEETGTDVKHSGGVRSGLNDALYWVKVMEENRLGLPHE